ncbi:MAG: sugar transferase [Isosphaeraceae bacterium]|nr:sugar transferase [Isosphaeraceae bacterium]
MNLEEFVRGRRSDAPGTGASHPAPGRADCGPRGRDLRRPGRDPRLVSRAAKRALDAIGALVGLLVFAPLLAAVAAAVYLTMGRPVLFAQVRSGYRARPFILFKFRTMRVVSGPDGAALPDRERLTRLGRLLRRTSLDELPQLWNVLRGEMSLVGPRPLLPEYLPLYTPEQARRHEARPGLTGWAQIRGRNAVSWGDRLADDVWYVDHQSLALDLKILALTCLRVLDGRGVSGEGEATMARFRGSAGGTA